jgi:hypothetical protein
MKIKMITLAAGPNGNLLAGHEYTVPGEVSQAEADALVAGGYAVIAKAAPVVETIPAPISEPIETADLKEPADAESADLLTADAKAAAKAAEREVKAAQKKAEAEAKAAAKKAAQDKES